MTRNTDSNDGFTAEERAAMKEHAAELRAAKRRSGKKELEAQACLDKIAEMPDADRVIAERIHALVSANAPELDAKTWYGMPAYARDGQVICFFQPASKFKARYGTFGFNDGALLDDGSVWATSFAVAGLAEADEAFLGELIRRAVSEA
ncbi:DUF1801 domain-containing protein [Micropruina sp.]|uniref:iron chaperone n=1 Tax=Micropruina sp. TaxID=2737536 RepID=UPI00260747B7|nr:DUF1801 domain-containing protein [Micropruina sp.]